MNAKKLIIHNCGDEGLNNIDCLQAVAQSDLSQKDCITTLRGRLGMMLAVNHQNRGNTIVCRVSNIFLLPNIIDFSIKRSS